jgi:hypothetical protein
VYVTLFQQQNLYCSTRATLKFQSRRQHAGVVHNENITCAQILDNVAYVPMLNFILRVNE